jgi:hypothetical protein
MKCKHQWKRIGVELKGNNVSMFSDVNWCRLCGAVKIGRKMGRTRRLYPKRKP